ncbi:twinkle protein, mitochondrial isoform X2 [Bombus pyrosoma]|uniref:twinkle protein, mitochondrial isoform X2 n=1 Tax=Bombus pyrosoma TaxID=396416 RepID=UPI001CB92C2B|nr:twinkle protein, mitochondrial isoform X2 [Bombus pyrosoma]
MFKLLCTCVRKTQCIKYYNKQHLHINSGDSLLNMSVSHLKHFLKQQCTNIIEGYTCIITDCPICSNTKRKSKLYVNKTTGLFMCDKCKCTGSWDILERFLSIQKSDERLNEFNMLKDRCCVKENFQQIWKNMTDDCQSIKDLSAEEYKTVLDNFLFPDISQEALSQLKCFYNKTSNVLYLPLVGLNNSIVGYKLLSTNPQKEETVPASGVSGCIEYKQYHSKNDNSAVVVGTIDDMLSLISKKSTSFIICLPYNLRNLPQQLLPYMESFKKLILWFGNDEISWYTAKQFAKKFNEKRCYFIRPTESQPRPKLAAKMNYNLNNILQNAQPLWHKSIITFQDLKEEILSDLQNNDKVQGVKWKRYPTLNRILKGHRRGCGKTTFMSEYSLDLAMQGVNTLWGSFEIRNARLARTMLQQMAGVPLDENLENFDSYANAFEKLPIYFMTFHGQQNIKVVMDAVEHATYIHDIAHVVIDNVQFMMGTSSDSKYMDRFWKQDEIIAKFRNFATMYNCHVTMIIHPRKERSDEELTTSSIFGSAKASQEADNVLIIQDNRLTSLRGKKYLQIAKNRYSGDLGIMILDFDKSKLSYTSRLKGKEKSNEKK